MPRVAALLLTLVAVAASATAGPLAGLVGTPPPVPPHLAPLAPEGDHGPVRVARSDEGRTSTATAGDVWAVVQDEDGPEAWRRTAHLGTAERSASAEVHGRGREGASTDGRPHVAETALGGRASSGEVAGELSVEAGDGRRALAAPNRTLVYDGSWVCACGSPVGAGAEHGTSRQEDRHAFGAMERESRRDATYGAAGAGGPAGSVGVWLDHGEGETTTRQGENATREAWRGPSATAGAGPVEGTAVAGEYARDERARTADEHATIDSSSAYRGHRAGGEAAAANARAPFSAGVGERTGNATVGSSASETDAQGRSRDADAHVAGFGGSAGEGSWRSTTRSGGWTIEERGETVGGGAAGQPVQARAVEREGADGQGAKRHAQVHEAEAAAATVGLRHERGRDAAEGDVREGEARRAHANALGTRVGEAGLLTDARDEGEVRGRGTAVVAAAGPGRATLARSGVDAPAGSDDTAGLLVEADGGPVASAARARSDAREDDARRETTTVEAAGADLALAEDARASPDRAEERRAVAGRAAEREARAETRATRAASVDESAADASAANQRAQARRAETAGGGVEEARLDGAVPLHAERGRSAEPQEGGARRRDWDQAAVAGAAAASRESDATEAPGSAARQERTGAQLAGVSGERSASATRHDDGETETSENASTTDAAGAARLHESGRRVRDSAADDERRDACAEAAAAQACRREARRTYAGHGETSESWRSDVEAGGAAVGRDGARTQRADGAAESREGAGATAAGRSVRIERVESTWGGRVLLLHLDGARAAAVPLP